ncbi:formyltransferase family protein [Actinoplanes sp. NPDC049681]|uniref:formyltransferase family protein n=1 Tax=Actinoplanes sp. NPDC049681 TaxID=3363905 RepID=UPI0037ABC1E1
MTPLRLALIRGDDHQHRYLESLLAARFDLALVVVEPESARVAALRRLRRYRDWIYHLYHRLRRAITGKDAYRRQYFAHSPELWADPGPRRLRVRSVNDDAVVDALRAVFVDVVVVIGCSALSKATLDAAGPLVINVHSGCLPYYRGEHAFFFAVYERRFDRIGSTIHRAGPGIGTGELIEVVRPQVSGDELPEQLRCRSDLLAIHRLAGWLEILERGGELPSYAQPAGGHTYGIRDRGPTHDLRYLLRRWLGSAGPLPPATDARRPVTLEGAVRQDSDPSRALRPVS